MNREESSGEVSHRFLVGAVSASLIVWTLFGASVWIGLEGQSLWIRAPAAVALGWVLARLWFWLVVDTLHGLVKSTNGGACN